MIRKKGFSARQGLVGENNGFFSIVSGDVVENGRLNRRYRRRLAWGAWKNERRTNLVGALDKSNRELRPKRSHSPAPCLAGRGIPKAERLEIISWVVEKSLCSLIVDIETPLAWRPEQWRNPTVE